MLREAHKLITEALEKSPNNEEAQLILKWITDSTESKN